MIIVQILIFLGCTAFHPLFHAWRLEVLVRKCFLRYLDTKFHVNIHHIQYGFAALMRGVLFLE